MPPRLNKRQQRELEEIEALSKAGPSSAPSSESEEEIAPVKTKVPTFAALVDDNVEDNLDDDNDEDEAPKASSKNKKSKKKKKKPAAPAASSTKPDETTEDPSQPTISKAERKAAKKAKAKERKNEKPVDELDEALKELSVKYPELQVVSASQPAASSSISASADGAELASLLSVQLQFLDAEAEMRKFFGAKVVNASKSSSSSSAGPASGSRRGRSYLTRPPQAWYQAQVKAGEGLSLNPTPDEKSRMRGESWWTVQYSGKYKAVTQIFMQTVSTGDPHGFTGLLNKFPWHADTLLQLAEVSRHREEYAQAVEFTDRALFSYERAFLGTGSWNFTTGLCRLDFGRVENRVFYLALHRQAVDLQRRGTPRTAFEVLRLLYSLDPYTDPHASLLHLDYVAIKAGMKAWVVALCDLFEKRWLKEDLEIAMNPTMLPCWRYSRALVEFLDEKERKVDHDKSTQLLVGAIKTFPTVLPLLADKIDVPIPDDIRQRPAFKIELDGRNLIEEISIVHLLSHLYAQRSFSVWKDPAITSWFRNTVNSLVSLHSDDLPTFQPEASLALFHSGDKDATTQIKYSIYRHVLIHESNPAFRRLLSFIPTRISSNVGLSCDPLPPPAPFLRTSYSDSAFFSGVSTADVSSLLPAGPRFPRTRRQREEQGRMLARMVPDAEMRRQLVALYEEGGLRERLGGGQMDVLQFVNVIMQLPEEAVMEMVENAAVMREMRMHIRDGGGMPGAFGEEGEEGGGEVELRFVDEPAAPGERRDGREEHVDMEDEVSDEDVVEDGDEDEQDDEDVAPMPVRLLRNVLGRFWGGSANAVESSDESEDEAEGIRDEAGVD